MPTDAIKRELSAEFLAQLQLLRTKYCDSLRAKEQELEDIIASILTFEHDAQTLADLHLIVHQLAGTAPTHGFTEVAKHAAVIERKVSKGFTVSQPEDSNMELLLELEDLTKNIRLSVENYSAA